MAGAFFLLLAGVLTAVLACGGVAGSPSPGADAGPQVVAQNVGPSGGIISLGGLTLTIPPGALTSLATITITQTIDPAPSGYVGFSAVYRFEPPGLTFAIPAILLMPFSGDQTRATLFWSRPDGSGYDRVATQVLNGAAIGDVTHFSTGFVGMEEPADASEGATDATMDASASDATTDAAGMDTTVTDATMGVDASDEMFGNGDGGVDADDGSEAAADVGGDDGGLSGDAEIDAALTACDLLNGMTLTATPTCPNATNPASLGPSCAPLQFKTASSICGFAITSPMIAYDSMGQGQNFVSPLAIRSTCTGPDLQCGECCGATTGQVVWAQLLGPGTYYEVSTAGGGNWFGMVAPAPDATNTSCMSAQPMAIPGMASYGPSAVAQTLYYTLSVASQAEVEVGITGGYLGEGWLSNSAALTTACGGGMNLGSVQSVPMGGTWSSRSSFRLRRVPIRWPSRSRSAELSHWASAKSTRGACGAAQNGPSTRSLAVALRRHRDATQHRQRRSEQRHRRCQTRGHALPGADSASESSGAQVP